MTKYPAQIDNLVTLPLVADNSSPVAGETVNRLTKAIIATEAELGIKPSGTYTTVRARLDALDATLANLQISGLDGDVHGGLSTTKVVGFGGRPFSDEAPDIGEVITWNGIAWVPASNQSVVVNVLPTTIVIPQDIVFLSGDGYANTTAPFRVGARAIDMAYYPSSYPDGRNRTMRFIANLEVSNANTDGYVQLKDITHNVVILNSVLRTNSLSSVEVSGIITSGTTDGYMREDCCDLTMYEAQIFLKNGAANDLVICRNCRIEVSYSAPILVSALVPLALPTDLQFVAGTVDSGFTTPNGMGGRFIDLAKFPNTLPDGRSRTCRFVADVEISQPFFDGYVQLFDTSHNVPVTNTTFHFTNTVANELSVILTVGNSLGNLRNDAAARYEVRLWKIGGSVTDRAICNNARVTITYA